MRSNCKHAADKRFDKKNEFVYNDYRLCMPNGFEKRRRNIEAEEAEEIVSIANVTYGTVRCTLTPRIEIEKPEKHFSIESIQFKILTFVFRFSILKLCCACAEWTWNFIARCPVHGARKYNYLFEICS